MRSWQLRAKVLGQSARFAYYTGLCSVCKPRPLADGNKAGKKRQVRDAKFGFGGRKKLQKQNSAESSADMRGARTGQPGGKPGGKPGKGKAGLGPKGGVKKRPGKEARSAKRSRGGGR